MSLGNREDWNQGTAAMGSIDPDRTAVAGVPSGAGEAAMMLGGYRTDLHFPSPDAIYADRLARDRRQLIMAAIVAGMVMLASVSMLVTSLVGRGSSSGSVSGKRQQVVVKSGEVEITLPVKAPKLDDQGSRVPLRISGKNPNGSTYDSSTYVEYDGGAITLPPGSFTVYTAESPIAGDGTMYVLPAEEDCLTIDVSENLEVSASSSDFTIKLETMSAIDVSDELIERARAWVENDPERKGDADRLAEQARKKRDEAIASEKARAAEAEAAKAREYAETNELEAAQNGEERANADANNSDNNRENQDSNNDNNNNQDSGNDDGNKSDDKPSDGGNSGDSGDSGNSGNTGTDTGGNSGDNTGGDTGGNTGTDTGGGSTEPAPAPEPTPAPEPEPTPEPTPAPAETTPVEPVDSSTQATDTVPTATA